MTKPLISRHTNRLRTAMKNSAELWKRARKIAERIKKEDDLLIVTHIDADGITAGSIAAETLKNLDKDFEIRFLKQLDALTVSSLKEDGRLLWFTDLGAGMANIIGDAVITDHHEPVLDVPMEKRGDIMAYADAVEKVTAYHLNPHLFGYNGSTDISGAGTAFMVAYSVSKKNAYLSALAIVGAVGDMQALKTGRLEGLNREILEIGRKSGVVEWKMDISLYGRETRELHKMLQYASEPPFPGIAGDEEASIAFLLDIGIDLKDEKGKWRRWVDLADWERKRAINALMNLMLDSGYPADEVERLISEVYILTREEIGTVLHDAKEFSTLLNSCGRYGFGDIGYRVCSGDRGKYLEKAMSLLQGHRKILVEMLGFIKDGGIREYGSIQYFHGGDSIPEEITGTLAGMALSSGMARNDMPIFAFTMKDDGNIKVSGRATQSMVNKGLRLDEIMNKASERLGGAGGGHDIAAGATIPVGSEDAFLEIADEMVRKQMRKAN